MTSRILTTRNTRRKLVRMFPRCFRPHGQPKLPLKIDILDDILWRCPHLERTQVMRALGDYCGGTTYQSVIILGAVRYDLDGAAAGFVNRAQAFRAAKKLKTMAQRSPRPAAIPAATRPAQAMP